MSDNICSIHGEHLRAVLKFQDILAIYRGQNDDIHSVSIKIQNIIVNGNPSLLEIEKYYNEILEWAKIRNLKERNLNIIKDGIIAIHQECFKERYDRLEKKNNEKQRKLHETMLALDKKMNEDCQVLIQRFEAIEKYINIKLNLHVKKLSPYFLKDDMPDEKSIHELKKRVINYELGAVPTFEKISSIPPFIAPVENPKINKNERAETILKKLDDAIRRYESLLQAEPWYKKFIHLFSFERRKRKSALIAYHNEVSTHQCIESKLRKAIKWYKDQKKKMGKNDLNHSRFAKMCLLSFEKDLNDYQEELNQEQFESLPYVSEPIRKKEEGKIKEISLSIVSHNKKIACLQAKIKKASDQASEMREKIADLHTKINNLQEFSTSMQNYYVPIDTAAVIEAQERVQSILVSKESREKDQKATKVAIGIMSVNRETKKEELQQLSNKAKEVKDSPEIKQAVDRVIEDTRLYGADGINAAFMGITKSTVVAGLFGTREQKDKHREAKKVVEEKSVPVCIDIEEQLVNDLDAGFKTGSLQQRLVLYFKAYQQHRRKEGQQPTLESEEIYREGVKKQRALAVGLHQKKIGKLKNYVQKVIDAVFNAASFHRDRQQTKNEWESLTWQQINMFVEIYGDSDQIEHWQKNIAPVLLEKEKEKNTPTVTVQYGM